MCVIVSGLMVCDMMCVWLNVCVVGVGVRRTRLERRGRRLLIIYELMVVYKCVVCVNLKLFLFV